MNSSACILLKSLGDLCHQIQSSSFDWFIFKAYSHLRRWVLILRYFKVDSHLWAVMRLRSVLKTGGFWLALGVRNGPWDKRLWAGSGR